MTVHEGKATAPGRRVRLLAAAVLGALLALLLPAASFAAVTTIGSPLSAPATLNTAENLNYLGTNTDVLPIPEAPKGVVHTYHYGADTALWNAGLAGRRRPPSRPPGRP